MVYLWGWVFLVLAWLNFDDQLNPDRKPPHQLKNLKDLSLPEKPMQLVSFIYRTDIRIFSKYLKNLNEGSSSSRCRVLKEALIPSYWIY